MAILDIESEEETKNVLISTAIIGIIIILFSFVVLWVETQNFYLDAYYTIETFFDAPNVAASASLASLAFNSNLSEFVLITIVVILDNLGKIVVISFVIAAVLDIIKYANVEDAINRFKAGRLSDHIIIAGYNELSRDLIYRLNKKKVRFLVIDPDPRIALQLNRDRILSITGKFTESHYLMLASIDRARAIVFTSPKDLDNLLGAITAKKLNKKIRLVSRVSGEEIRNKMYRVGVEMCVLPEYLAGIELGESIVKATRGAGYGV